MAGVPRCRLFVPTVSKLVPKQVQVEFKNFKRGTGTVTRPEVPSDHTKADILLPDEPLSEDDDDLESLNSSCRSDDDDEFLGTSVSSRLNQSAKDVQKEETHRLDCNDEDMKDRTDEGEEDSVNVVDESFENVEVDAIISLDQLDDTGKLLIGTAEGNESSTGGKWQHVSTSPYSDLFVIQTWRQEFDLTHTEKPLVQTLADNMTECVIEHLKSFFSYEKAFISQSQKLNDQLPHDIFQILKFEIQNHRKEKREYDLEEFVNSLREYLKTAISYRARKLRRTSLVSGDKMRSEFALSIALFDEVRDAIDRRYDRLSKTTQPDLQDDELQGIKLAIYEVKKLLRESLQTKVCLAHSPLQRSQLDTQFVVIDKRIETLLMVVFQDTESSQRTGSLLLECTYELVDIIVKKLTPAHEKTLEEIIEEFVTHALHILAQELNKRGIAV